MSQHDMDVANAPGITFRTDMNAALQALASQSSGAAAPSTTFPCQVWADTGTNRLKKRNSANTAWLDMGALDSTLRDAVSAICFAVDTGAANAYVCNFTPAITARSESVPIRFKATNANTGSCTINDGLGVVALVGVLTPLSRVAKLLLTARHGLSGVAPLAAALTSCCSAPGLPSKWPTPRKASTR